jgi:TetR/AcrR family transcriptional regulator, cholesterol catabolism regulator
VILGSAQPAPTQRKVAAQEIRWRIVSAATELFAENGFVSPSMDDIAKRAYVTKRTVYRHMMSKDGVLAAIHERMLEVTMQSLEASGAASMTSARDKLVQHIRVHIAAVTNFITEATVFFEQMKYLSPETRAAVVARRDLYEGEVRDIIAQGIESGEFRECSPQVCSQYLLGAINYMYRWYRSDNPLPPERVADIAVDLVLNGFDGRCSASPPLVVDRAMARTRRAAEDLQRRWLDPSVTPKFDEVADVAAGLFAAKGFHGTRAADLAEATNLGKGTLYYYIEGKSRLLSAVLERGTAASERCLAAAILGTTADDEVLANLITQQCNDVATRQFEVRVALQESRYLPADAAAALAARERAIRDIIAQVISASSAASKRSLATAQTLANLEIGAAVFISTWFRSDGQLRSTDIGHQFADLFLRGISREKSKAAAVKSSGSRTQTEQAVASDSSLSENFRKS